MCLFFYPLLFYIYHAFERKIKLQWGYGNLTLQLDRRKDGRPDNISVTWRGKDVVPVPIPSSTLTAISGRREKKSELKYCPISAVQIVSADRCC